MINELKKTKRYSEVSRPRIGDRVVFSPGLVLLCGGFVLPHQPLQRCKRCKVIENLEHIIRVQFDRKVDNDLVSPEFILPLEITKAEEELRNELLKKGALKV